MQRAPNPYPHIRIPVPNTSASQRSHAHRPENQERQTAQDAYKLSDGRGLHLLIMPNGSRPWRFRFRYARRESMLRFGPYPDVSLKAAREQCEDMRKHVAAKRDPAAVRRHEKTARANTFEAAAREWLGKQNFAFPTQERAPLDLRGSRLSDVGLPSLRRDPAGRDPVSVKRPSGVAIVGPISPTSLRCLRTLLDITCSLDSLPAQLPSICIQQRRSGFRLVTDQSLVF